MKRKSATCKTALIASCALLASLMMGCPGGTTSGGGVKPTPTTSNAKLSIQGQDVQLIRGTDTTRVALSLGRIALLDLGKKGSPALRHDKFIFAKQWEGLKESGRLLTIKSSRLAATLDINTMKLTAPKSSFVTADNTSGSTIGTPGAGRDETAFDLTGTTFVAVAKNGNETVLLSCCDEPCEPIDIATAIRRAGTEKPSIMDPCIKKVSTDGNETVIILECNIIDPKLEGRLEQIYPGLGSLIHPGDPVAAQQAVPMSYLVPWNRLDESFPGTKGGGLRDPNPPRQKSMAPANPKANARGEEIHWNHDCVIDESKYQVTVCDNVLIITSVDSQAVTKIDMGGCMVGLSSQNGKTIVHYNDACAAQMRNLPCM